MTRAKRRRAEGKAALGSCRGELGRDKRETNSAPKGRSAVRGFGLARSTRYTFSLGVTNSLSLPVLASIRTRVPPLSRPSRDVRKVPSLPSISPRQRYTSTAGGRRSRLQVAEVDSFHSPTRSSPPGGRQPY